MPLGHVLHLYRHSRVAAIKEIELLYIERFVDVLEGVAHINAGELAGQQKENDMHQHYGADEYFIFPFEACTHFVGFG